MRISKILLLATLTWTLAACSLPEPGERASKGGADFMVDSIRGEVVDTAYEESFSLPKARTYNYTACVKSLSHSRPLVGQEFEIIEAKKTVKADAQGCVNWSEEVEFNYLSESIYIPVERTILAKGFSRGSRQVRFGINPWSHGDAAPGKAVDLSKTEVAVLKAESSPKIRSLWMEDARLSVADDRVGQGGLVLTYQVYGAPRLVLNNIHGEKVLEPLKRGRFKAVVSLIQQDLVKGQQIRVEIARHEIPDVSIKNESLALRAPMVLPKVPKSGQLFLGVELEAFDAKAGIEGFQGVFSMGDFKAIRSPNFLKVSPLVTENPGFRMESFVTPQAELKGKDGQSVQPHQQRASFEIDHLDFARIQRGAESTLKKEVVYSIRACIQSGVDQDRLMSRQLLVTKARFSDSDPVVQVPIKTDHTSCLYWEEKLPFDYYACQRFQKGHILIENADLGLKEKVEFVINPWDNGAAFAFDLRDVDSTKNITLTCDPNTALKAHVNLKNYSYETKSLQYDVDENLNLLVRKNIRFKLSPEAILYSNLSAGIMDNYIPLRDGPYLLRLAVVRNKDYDSSNTYVTHAEKLVKVYGGRLVTTVPFVIRDLKALGNRNTLFAELHPVDPKKVVPADDGDFRLATGVTSHNEAIARKTEIVSEVFTSTITLNEDHGGQDFDIARAASLTSFLVGTASPASSTPSDLISLIIRDGWNLQREQLRKSAQLGEASAFARSEGLRFANLKTLPKEPNSRAFSVQRKDLQDFGMRRFSALESWKEAKAKVLSVPVASLRGLLNGKWDQRAVEAMCLYFNYELLGTKWDNGLQSLIDLECRQIAQKDPSKFFMIEKRRLVRELKGVEQLNGRKFGLKVSASFSLSNSYSQSHNIQKQIGTSLGVGAKPFGFISLGLSGGYSASWSTSESQGTSNSITVAEDTGLEVTENFFRLKVGASERCAVIRLNPELFKEKKRTWYLYKATNYSTYLREDLSEAEKLEAARAGVFLCSGEVERAPFEVVESFYVINQETGGDAQDGQDERNRPFFLALRGKTDYERFRSLTESNPTIPSSAESNGVSLKDIGTSLELSILKTKTAPKHVVMPN